MLPVGFLALLEGLGFYGVYGSRLLTGRILEEDSDSNSERGGNRRGGIVCFPSRVSELGDALLGFVQIQKRTQVCGVKG